MPRKASSKKVLNKKAVSLVKEASPAPAKKGRTGLVVLALIVIFLAIEGISVLINKANAEKFYIVKTALSFAGTGQSCKAFNPWDVALTGKNVVAISDPGNNRILYFNLQGKYLYETNQQMAGPPKFNEISRMSSDPDGNVYVADCWCGLIRGFNGATGRPVVKVPVTESYGPRGVAWDNGNFLVADTGNSRIVKLDPNGKRLASIGGPGKDKGLFAQPAAVAVDASGNFYVADPGNLRIQCLDQDGKFLREYKMASGPSNVAVDSKGIVYAVCQDDGITRVFTNDGKFLGMLTDAENQQPIQHITGIKVTPAGDIVACKTDQILILEPAPSSGGK